MIVSKPYCEVFWCCVAELRKSLSGVVLRVHREGSLWQALSSSLFSLESILTHPSQEGKLLSLMRQTHRKFKNTWDGASRHVSAHVHTQPPCVPEDRGGQCPGRSAAGWRRPGGRWTRGSSVLRAQHPPPGGLTRFPVMPSGLFHLCFSEVGVTQACA